MKLSLTHNSRWKTKEDDYLEISEMKTSHIINCINKLKRDIDNHEDDDFEYMSMCQKEYYLREFEIELIVRKLNGDL